MSVLPGVTAPSACSASGDGYLEGRTDNSASFLIYAADAYGNAQWPWLHRDYFRIVILPLASPAVPSYCYYANVSLASSTINGVYQASYIVPTLTVDVTQYNISVQLLGSDGIWRPIGTPTSTATILPLSTTLIAEVSGPDFPTPQIGRSNTWYVVDRSGTTQTATLAVLIYSADASVQYSGTAYAQPLIPNNYTLFPFTPNFHLPLTQSGAPQLFFVNISRAGLLSTAPQPNATFIAGQPAPLNCNVTLSYPIPLTVGSTVTVQAQLVDAYSNLITSPLPSGQLLNASMVCSSTPATSAAGSPQLYAVGQWQPVEQVYKFTFQPTVACPYSVAVLYQSSLLNGRSFSVQAVAGPASAALSSVQTSTGTNAVSATAGTSFSLTVTLNDAFGNPVDNSHAPNSNLSVAVADGAVTQPDASAVFPSVYSGQAGIYTVQITPYAATNAGSPYWPVSVALNSQSVLGSPVRLTVGAASIATSALSAPSTVVAGQPWLIQLSLFDQYGNAASLAASRLSLTALMANPSSDSYSTPLGYSSSDASFVNNSAGSASQYTYTFYSTSTAGPYSFSLMGNGVVVPSAALSLLVLAEQIFVNNTLVPSVLYASVAGASNSLLLTLRDTYDNVISNSSYASLISLQLWSWSGTYTCDEHLRTDDTVMPELVQTSTSLQPAALIAQPAVFLTDTSQFEIDYVVYVAGRFTITVLIGGVSLPCTSLLPALAQTISPARPSSNTSQLIGVPSRSTAGALITLYVDLFDQYGNSATPAAYSVTVPSSSSQLAGPLPAGALSDPTNWLSASLSSNSSDGSGRYTLTAQPTLAKQWSAIVSSEWHTAALGHCQQHYCSQLAHLSHLPSHPRVSHSPCRLTPCPATSRLACPSRC